MISRTLHLTLALGIALAATARAEDAEPKTAGLHLKNQSHFTAPQTVRSPFWPIGWAPAARGPVHSTEAPVQEFTLKPELFSVTSILLGSQSLAVINGRTYGEGEYLRLARGVKPAEGAAPALPAGVRIRVARIADGQVTLQAGVQAIQVALRRQQLSEKKPGGDEDLLLQAAADR